jgi:hypothetical protein
MHAIATALRTVVPVIGAVALISAAPTALGATAPSLRPSTTAADRSAVPRHPPAQRAQAAPAGAARQGDARRFNTWTGYEVGRSPTAVATADFDGDGRLDVAYAHYAFFNNFLTVQLTAGKGTMGKTKSYPAQDLSTDLATADLNGDTHPDLVSTAWQSSGVGSTVDLYLNKGDGTFTHTTATGGHGPTRLAVADLDGDGSPDLAMANPGIVDQGTTVSVLLNKGNGTFDPETQYQVGAGVFGVAAADLNGDGLIDLAVGQATGDEDAYHVIVLGNTGSTFKQKADVTIAGSPERFPAQPVVTAARLDGDAKVDLVAGAGAFDQLTLLRNTGNWSFTQSNWPASYGSTNLLTMDGNGDGRRDVVSAAPFGGEQSTGELAFLQNQGGGTFAAPARINQGYLPNDAGAADITGDGRDDLVVANQGSGTGSIDRQLKGGGFAQAPVYQSEPDLIPKDTASADFDGDGRIDMALSNIDVTSQGFDRVDIMHNVGHGRLQLAAALETGTDSHAKSVIAADLDGDGHPDLAWTPEFFIEPGTYPVAVALNQGNGTFGETKIIFIQTCGTGHVSAIDVDADSKLDLVVANDRSGPSQFCDEVSRTIRILINHGDGTFDPDYGVQIGSSSSMVAGADLNDDGIIDLVDADAITHVLIGTGGGQFKPAVAYESRGNELVIADVDEDGDPDVATADGSLQHVWIMRNKGNGTFTERSYPGEQIPEYLTGNGIDIGDLDGDGNLDLAVSDAQGQDVGVFYGRGDGTFRPEIRYGVQYDFGDVNVADYDGDGRPDIGGPAGIGGALNSVAEGVTTLINRSR